MMSRKRRIVFSIIVAAIPLVILAGTELLLRLTGWFAQEPLLVEVPGSEGTLVGFNPFVGRRYFDASQSAVPMMTPDVFQYAKSSVNFRVLCLGESSTGGFPFECQVPFPRQLRQILTEAYPNRRVEVLDAGMSAISSYVIVDLLPELLDTSPDLVVVYAGHNEFYGRYGSASSLFPGGNDLRVRAALAAQKTRLGQMVRRIVAWFRPSTADSVASATLMERVIGDQLIRMDSPRYERTKEAFRRNLERIADACQARGIPVIFGTLVSNDRNMPPFHAQEEPAGVEAATVREHLRKGEVLLDAGRWQVALVELVPVADRDPRNADACYCVARALMMKGDTTAARALFTRARDCDVMRFRAPSDFNAVIAGVARERGAGLVDIADVFAARSPGRVIGSEWICDHLHPTPQGYYVMAAAYFVGIQHLHLLPPPDSTFHPRETAYGVTALDWDIGMMKIFLTTHRWPFRATPVTLDDYVPVGDTTTARIAHEYLYGHNVWSRAHNDMAQEYLHRGKFELARREYEAVAVYSPEDPWPYRMMAETYGTEKNLPLRSAALREALRRPGPQGMLAYQLGLCEMEMKHTAKAIRAMGVAAEAPEFDQDERQNARFYLAGLLSDAGQMKDALALVQVMLQEDSTYVPALKLRAMLRGTQ